MRLTILSSGSGGNTLCIESGQTVIYVDAGLRNGRLRERWQRLEASTGEPRRRPSAAFLTHEHADHVAGADDLAVAGVHLYATAGTASGLPLSERGRAAVRELGIGQTRDHGALQITPIPIPHDAAAPVAYVISDGEHRLGIITDCGAPKAELAPAFADCDALLLETNHDRALLFGGPYPERLKRRITSGEGHLSNEQSATLLTAIREASSREPALVICAHLSKVNNRPELALRAVRAAIDPTATRVVIAAQDDPLAPIEICKGRSRKAQQLCFGL